VTHVAVLQVVDTNVALHQLDLLEHNCPATSFIVVFQTVLEELRKLNLSAFRRLNQLMNNDARMFIFLPNEHIAQTRIERQIDETMNDRNDRAIRTAAKWLKEQITEGELILLSNDKLNRTKAQADGLVAMSMREYVSTFIEDYPELMDLLAATDEAAHADLSAENIYPEHLPVSELNAGIRSGR
jgi:exosome complex exonuclease DIS3/RRP44